MFNQHRTRTRAIQGVIDIPTSGALKYPSLIVSEDTRLKSMSKWILRDLEYKMDWFTKIGTHSFQYACLFLLQDFLVNLFMTSTNTVEQLFPIVATTKILESFIVHRKPFYDVLIQSLCSPLTETSALNRFYTIAHRYDNIKVTELHFFALGFSCHSTMLSGLSEFPNNHFFIKFSLFKNI